LLAAAVAVAAAIAFVVTRQGARESKVVFVDAREHADDEEEAPNELTPPVLAAPAPAEPAAPVVPEAAAAPKPTPAKPGKEDEVGALTRAFGARRKQVEGCFTAHSAALEGAPRIHVDFEISAEGKVTRAGLDPSAIENTELGRCILKVAQATLFPKQQGNLRFRIPLTARGQ